MEKKPLLYPLSILLLTSVSLFASACGTLEIGIEPTFSPTAAVPVVQVVPTATLQIPPMDLCHEYLELLVSSAGVEEQAVATCYRCRGATIDSTGQSRSPTLTVDRDTPIYVRLAVEQRPMAIDVRLYPAAGVSATFLRWPEELPTRVEPVDRFQPELSTTFQYLPQVSSGAYSLVVKVAWEEDVEVFYAISLAMPAHTPTPMSLPTPTATPTPVSPVVVLEQASDEVKLDVAEQIGGYSLAVVVEQGMIYLGIGPRVVVLDDAFPLTEPMPIGQSDVLPGIVQDIYLVNNLAYVAAGEAGLIVLDVADPANIRVLGTASTPGDAQSVVVGHEDGLVYVASGGQLGPWEGGTLSIIDVSKPDMPMQVASVEMPGFAHRVALIEHYAYVLYEGGLLVLDVSDLASPVEIVRVGVSQGARALVVTDGYAYVAGYGLQGIDVSDPAAPRQVSSFEVKFPTWAVTVQGETAYLADTFCEMGHCGSTIHIVDVSDPARPQEVGTWFTKSAVQDALVHENILYLTSWQKGLQVVDVSDPANPHLLGEYATLPNVEDVAVSHGYAYVSDGAEAGLQVLDLGGAASGGLRVRGSAESAKWAAGYAVVDGYAYVPVWASGFRIVDVNDPDNPLEVAAADIGMTEQAVVVGERAYVTIGYKGLAILDIADPSEPRVLGEVSLNGLAEGLAVAGDQAYVTVDDGEQDVLYVIDIADPSQPSEMARAALKGKGLNIALASKAGYAYVAVADCTYYLGIPQCSGGLQVIDVSDPSRPQTVVFVEVPGGVLGIAVSDDYAFVAAGSEGVWVLDVSEPEHSRAVGWRDTAGRARNVVVADDLVHVADGDGGLLILRVEW